MSRINGLTPGQRNVLVIAAFAVFFVVVGVAAIILLAHHVPGWSFATGPDSINLP